MDEDRRGSTSSLPRNSPWKSAIFAAVGEVIVTVPACAGCLGSSCALVRSSSPNRSAISDRSRSSAISRPFRVTICRDVSSARVIVSNPSVWELSRKPDRGAATWGMAEVRLAYQVYPGLGAIREVVLTPGRNHGIILTPKRHRRFPPPRSLLSTALQQADDRSMGSLPEGALFVACSGSTNRATGLDGSAPENSRPGGASL